jgi:hypothetical protein
LENTYNLLFQRLFVATLHPAESLKKRYVQPPCWHFNSGKIR